MNRSIAISLFLGITLFFFIFILTSIWFSNKWGVNMMPKPNTKLVINKLNYVDVPNVVVNLSGRNAKYCKAGFTLSVGKKNAKQLAAGEYMSVIQSAVIQSLSSCAPEDLLTYEGKMRLKRTISNKINNKLSAQVVNDVYLRELVIQ
ncbi:MAG: hypothetical protein GY868_20590 [Deltaproteobacteria bacterium]|nr:hypothetical protein [Deltaproteobacteria bacterium]